MIEDIIINIIKPTTKSIIIDDEQPIILDNIYSFDDSLTSLYSFDNSLTTLRKLDDA